MPDMRVIRPAVREAAARRLAAAAGERFVRLLPLSSGLYQVAETIGPTGDERSILFGAVACERAS